MIDLSVIGQISKKAKKSIGSGADNNQISNKLYKTFYYVLFYLIPLLSAFFCIYLEISLYSNNTYIFTGIAIFIGLFFSLLLSIGGKIKSVSDSKKLSKAHFDKFKNSMSQIADIILYIILLGVTIFLLIFIDSLVYHWKEVSSIYLMAFTAFLLMRFIVSIFFLMQRFYFTSRDEIKNIYWQAPSKDNQS